MPVDDSTPTASRGFQQWQYVLTRYAPKQWRRIIYSGKLIRAVTTTARGRR